MSYKERQILKLLQERFPKRNFIKVSKKFLAEKRCFSGYMALTKNLETVDLNWFFYKDIIRGIKQEKDCY